MTASETQIAVLESKVKYLEDRIEKLEGNQKWGVITILGLIANAVFKLLTPGGLQ